MTFAPNAPVIVAGQYGHIVQAATHGGAPGYTVQTSAHTLPHWAPEHAVQAAQVGVNVCRKPRGDCWCGLAHIPADALRALIGGRS